jgi:hypothetical protein
MSWLVSTDIQGSRSDYAAIFDACNPRGLYEDSSTLWNFDYESDYAWLGALIGRGRDHIANFSDSVTVRIEYRRTGELRDEDSCQLLGIHPVPPLPKAIG